MTAYVPKEVGESLDGREATVGRTVVSSSDLDTVATDPSDTEKAGAVPDRSSEGREGETKPDQNEEGEMKMSDSDHHDKIPEGLTKYTVEDSADYHSKDMLHYLGQPLSAEVGFGVGSNCDLTRERIRQLATTRLAEQRHRPIVMNEANFLFQREAAAMHQKANMTVSTKPLYPIGAPQRIRMPKPPSRYPDPLHRHPLYDGPLNLVNRSLMSAHPYGVAHHSADGPVDHSKPLDLSMKSDRLVAVSRTPKSIADPRLMIANAAMLANQQHAVCINGHDVTSNVTSAQTMYRPPPMMSYGKPGRHGNDIHSHPPVHRQHSLLPNDVPISHAQLHTLASTSIGPHIQATQKALKRPGTIMARSASDIPLKRAVHDRSLAEERLNVVPPCSVPTSVSLQTYQEANRAALLAYERERGRSRAVTLIDQESQDSQLRITDVRSIGSRAGTSHPGPKPTSGQTRSHTAKTGGAPVFHHIHHHHHHHHVPQPDEELLRPGSNGEPGAPVHAGVLAQGSDAVPANGIQACDIPIHRLAGRVIPGHDVPSHGMAAPNMTSRGDRSRGVLIKHASTPVSTITSPHLRRSHYHTRRRYRSISPPTLVSISGMTQLRRDSTTVTSTLGRVHHHARAVSPQKLVASSIAAGAKMNELLKPLDGPEQPASRGYNGANNNNNKVLVTDKLARPLRVDIPDDRAFVSHLEGVYSGQANPVPLVRQVSNVANITKCLTSEANSSPKKPNSSGNESPTMPVLTPQSVYSPCFTTESATNLMHMSSSIEPPPTSSPLFYNALTLPLYPRKQDVSSETIKKLPRAKDESPPHLHETSPEQLVPDQRVPSKIDSEMAAPDRRAERNRVESALQRQIDSYLLDAAAAFDKNKRNHRRIKETLQEQRDAYRRYRELCRGPLENRDKPRKRHTHLYGLKASMDKMKPQQTKKVKERNQSAGTQDDRNIFAQLMLQRQWYEAKTNTRTQTKDGQPQQVDVIDLTTSPSSSPAPDVPGNIVNRNDESGGIGKKKSNETPVMESKNDGGLGYSILSAFGEGKTVSVSEAIDAVFAAHLPIFPSMKPYVEHTRPDTDEKNPDLETQRPRRVSREAFYHKDQPPKLVKVQASLEVAPAVSTSDICAVFTSAKSSSVLPPFFTTNDVSKAETSLVFSSSSLSAHISPSFLTENSTVENPQLSTATGDVTQPIFIGNIQGTHSMTSSAMSLPHHSRYSPTEKTFSHDPRKKLLAAMSVHTPTLTPGTVSPASLAASLSSAVSPSSGRSTPSKSAARKRSLEISRLENTSSFVAEIPKRRQNVDLLTDPALLDREERALQRAMKRFNEMEKRERVTPTDHPTDPQTHTKRQSRLIFSKHSPLFRRGGRGRGRKFLSYQRLHQMQQDELTVVPGSNRSRRSFSHEMFRLNSHAGRNTFQDFVPMVLEERTRHSLATRSSARERKVYHKNARYEMEIEKEEQKYLERKRQKRSVSGSTSGEEDSPSSRSKMTPGRRRKGSDDVLKTSSDVKLETKEQSLALSGELDCSTNPLNLSTDGAQEKPHSEEGVATSPSMDTPLHVVIDPTNLTKMKFMTSSAYQLHRKDSGKENKDGCREEVQGKQGGKRKFKTKHLEPAAVTMETSGRKDDNITIKTEVLDDHQMSTPPSLPPSEPIPVKVVRPCPPTELKRLMVNKKLGETILHRAARLAYDDVAIYCIDYDVVNINAKDNAGYTPLHECCVHGRLRVALHLLQHGADVNASASDGTRPIHDAVDNNWLALVRLLLMYGADPLIATYSGRTTIKLARTKAMKTFIIGYLSDVNGNWELDDDDPYQSNLDLCWHLAGTHSFDANDLAVSDIFQDVPGEKKSDEEEFLVELSETPHLTSYNIRLPKDQRARNWLLLTDVTNQLDTTRVDFLASNPTLRRVTMTHDEFTIAMKDSQLNCDPPEKSQLIQDEASGDYTVEMLELTSELRRTLHIEEEYV